MPNFRKICGVSVRLYAGIAIIAVGTGNVVQAEIDTGSGTRGIHGGDSRTRGIHGGDSRTRGIQGGDRSTLGIHGGDRRTRGIHGGDRRTRGIHGGDRSTRGVNGGENRIFDSAAMGPIESLEVIDDGYRLTVLGQTFLTNVMSETVSEGDYVLAAGSDGSLDILMPIGMAYVAGASPVLIRGTVDTVKSSTASLTIGELSINYSAQLSVDGEFLPESGEAIEFKGIQPLPGGYAMLNFHSDTESYLLGIHGGDSRTRGIHGGDSRTRGIHGGDTR